MLLDLYFLLVVRRADGDLVEIAVSFDLLQHAQTLSVEEYEVELEHLEASIAIDVLEHAQSISGGEFEVMSACVEPTLDTNVSVHTETPATNDRSITLEVVEPVVTITALDVDVVTEGLDGTMTTIAVEVLDL